MVPCRLSCDGFTISEDTDDVLEEKLEEDDDPDPDESVLEELVDVELELFDDVWPWLPQLSSSTRTTWKMYRFANKAAASLN